MDLYLTERPRACLNFLKLCKIKYYNFNLFHMVSHGFIAQTGDPTGAGDGGDSIWGILCGESKRYFQAETIPRIKHTKLGLISFVGDNENMLGSQFFITLAPDLMYLDARHCVFGEVVEGVEGLYAFNETICDNNHRPYQDIRITHTVVLDDPFPDPDNLVVPCSSPEPTSDRLKGGRIAPDEELDENFGKSAVEVAEAIADKEAKARATILEMVGDIPDAEMAPPENVLFVCKLNPVTNDDDLEIIFSRFGKIKSCEVIRDKKTGDSLQYAFVEFENQKACEDAYFKMDNVLIDDRRIHVDFSQSVAKVKWFGKGRIVYKEEGDMRSNLGKGKYKKNETKKSDRHKNEKSTKSDNYDDKRYRSRSKYEVSSREHKKYRKDRDEKYYDKKVSKYSRDDSHNKRRYDDRDYKKYSSRRRSNSPEYKKTKKKKKRKSSSDSS